MPLDRNCDDFGLEQNVGCFSSEQGIYLCSICIFILNKMKAKH